jgi:hypothetical protein
MATEHEAAGRREHNPGAFATLGWQASSDLGAVFQQLIEAFADERGPVQLPTALIAAAAGAPASHFLGLGLITLPSSILEVAAKTSQGGGAETMTNDPATSTHAHSGVTKAPRSALVCASSY